jgi:hypothetical protein
VTQSPIGQIGMMPIHVPQNEPAKQSRWLPALTENFVCSAHDVVLIAMPIS